MQDDKDLFDTSRNTRAVALEYAIRLSAVSDASSLLTHAEKVEKYLNGEEWRSGVQNAGEGV